MFEVLLLADPIPFHTFFHSDHSDWTGKESASILTTAECQEISRLQSCICAMKNDSKSLGLEKVCTLKSIGIHWFIVVYPGFLWKMGHFCGYTLGPYSLGHTLQVGLGICKLEPWRSLYACGEPCVVVDSGPVTRPLRCWLHHLNCLSHVGIYIWLYIYMIIYIWLYIYDYIYMMIYIYMIIYIWLYIYDYIYMIIYIYDYIYMIIYICIYIHSFWLITPTKTDIDEIFHDI